MNPYDEYDQSSDSSSPDQTSTQQMLEILDIISDLRFENRYFPYEESQVRFNTIATDNENKKVYITMTDIALFIYQIQESTREAELLDVYTYPSIQTMMTSENSLFLVTKKGKNLAVKFADINQAYNTLRALIYNCLIPDEYSLITPSFERSPLTSGFYCPSFLLRFRAFALEIGDVTLEKCIPEIEEISQSDDDTLEINFRRRTIYRGIKAIFMALRGLNRGAHIIVGFHKKKATLKYLKKYIIGLPNLNAITLSHAFVGGSFKELGQHVLNNEMKTSSAEHAHFELILDNSTIDSEGVNGIFLLNQKGFVRKLHFDTVRIARWEARKGLKELFEESKFEELEICNTNLSRCGQSLLNKIFITKIVKLTNIKVETNRLLKCMIKYGKVVKCELSKNPFKRKITTKNCIPQSLKKLAIRDVSTNAKTFVGIFSLTQFFTSHFHFVLDNITMKDNQWPILLDGMITSNFSLGKTLRFEWVANPINSKFILFLRNRCPHMHYLSLEKCHLLYGDICILIAGLSYLERINLIDFAFKSKAEKTRVKSICACIKV